MKQIKLNLKSKKKSKSNILHISWRLKLNQYPFWLQLGVVVSLTPQTTFEGTNLVHNYKCFQKETTLEIQGTK